MERWLQAFEDWLMFACLAAASVLGMTEVLLRYLFSTGIYWVEGVLIMLVVYASLVGASVAVRRGFHVRLELLVDKLAPGPRWWAFLAGNLLCLFFVLSLWHFGSLYVLQVIRYGEMNAETELGEWVHYSAVPLGMGLMSVRFAQQVWRLLRLGLEGLPGGGRPEVD
jgi:C4-dicarboxylate transporter DctQ subunit